ncbi:calcineurin B homologous protein 1-like [Brevipalpus obovatus]|uniref:calcineurin B homologous protein 1-like n=1 Tax=Brevipalpus obovatus TaxID=246614 RepID=UPI003D9DC0C9
MEDSFFDLDANEANRLSNRGLLSMDIERLVRKTGLTGGQIERLHWRWCSLGGQQKGYISSKDLQIPELIKNPFGERIIYAFVSQNPGGKLTFEDFVLSLARFAPHHKPNITINSDEAKLSFLFQVLDVENRQKITPEIMLAVVEALKGSSKNEEKMKETIKLIFDEIDIERKNYISFEEFFKALKESDVKSVLSFNFLN